MATTTVRPPPTPELAAPTAAIPDLSELLPLARAARRLPPTRGHSVAPSTLYRWATRGVVAEDGERVRLRVIQLGGSMRTTAAWLAEFGQELAERRKRAQAAAAAVDDPAAAAARRREREAATRATLVRAGIIDEDGHHRPARR
jgi:hypothetical protein